MQAISDDDVGVILKSYNCSGLSIGAGTGIGYVASAAIYVAAEAYIAASAAAATADL